MLLLRMWCKYVSMPASCVFYRAMCLSIQSLTQFQRENPEGTSFSNRTADHEQHRQPWAQHLLAATRRYGIPADRVDLCNHGLLVVQVDALLNGAWAPPSGAEPADAPVRIVTAAAANPAAPSVITEEGVNCWHLPAGTKSSTVLTTWSSEHKEACHTELRRLGNLHRQRQVRVFLADQIKQNSR